MAITISQLKTHIGQTVTLNGWLYNQRSSGKLVFLQLRDGTDVVQCVVAKDTVSPEQFELAKKITQESSLSVSGAVLEDKRSPLGVEIHVASVVLHQLAENYPITPKEHGTAFLFDHRHLWLRSRRQHAILRIRSRVIKSIRDFFDQRDFINLDAPIFTPNACEGTSTLFQVDYFGQPAYLTQSGQLYMEAGAMAFGKVYCFGPTFRAEKSKTRRHLTEFWMVEPEVAFLDLDGDMALAEEFILAIVQDVLAHCRPELATLERQLEPLEKIQPPFPRLSYDDAITLLHEVGNPIQWGDDFGADEETIISKQFDRPVMIHRYPAAVKPFYMKQDPANPRVALCVDMIAPEGVGEIIGGGQREDSLVSLETKLRTHGLDPAVFSWYLDLRRYGTVPHAGFGLGIERTVAWICGLHHVRETIPFPRLMERLTP